MTRPSRCCGSTAGSSWWRRMARSRRRRIATMLEYDFMQTAFEAGTVGAVVAGAGGYFLGLGNLAFAGPPPSHVGVSGAPAARLLGLAPVCRRLALPVA